MRTILISGGSRGIGNSIAKRALKDGHRISLGVRDPDKLVGSEFDSEKNRDGNVLICEYDANNPKSAKSWVEKSVSHFSQVDSVINCAGIFKNTPFNFKDNEVEDLDELWRTNIMGPWYLIKEAWKELIKTNESRVIVIVSMSGIRSKGKLAGYSVSKFGLMGLCQTIRNEGWEKGLRVTAICPSWVNTKMAESVKELKKDDMTQPDDIACITSLLLDMPNSCIPFEIKVNCNLEM